MRKLLALVALCVASTACDKDPLAPSGSLDIRIVTTGLDRDGQFTVETTGQPGSVAVSAGTTTTLNKLPPGSYTLILGDVASNCAVSGGSVRSVDLTADATAEVTFELACVAVTGAIEIRATMSGLDPDEDAFAVRVGAGVAQTVGVTIPRVIDELGPGIHAVTLTAVAPNCTAGPNPIFVQVNAGTAVRDTARVVFEVTCVAATGAIEVRATMSGLDRDPDAFTVGVNAAAAQTLGVTVPRVIEGLGAGVHLVTLSGLAPNCTVPSNPRGVPLSVGTAVRDTARVVFEVTCVAVTGVIEIDATVSGSDLDPDGFVVRAGSQVPHALAVNGKRIIEGLPGGTHVVALSGLASNCTAAAPNPRDVQVTVGTAVRDTARVTFTVTCARLMGGVRIIAQPSGLSVDQYYSAMIGDTRVPNIVDDYYYYPVVTPTPTGQHLVRLEDVAPNCTVAGANPRTITVVANITTDVVFQVTCTGLYGDLRITTRTTGADLDPDGYVLRNAGVLMAALPANGSITFPQILQGTLALRLDGAAPNCTVTGSDTRSVAIVHDATTDVEFVVTCVAATRIDVTVSTDGSFPDVNGYRIRATSLTVQLAQQVAATGTTSFVGYPQGTYTVTISDLAANCEVSGGSARTVSATGPVAQVSFAVTCAAPLEMIAFAADENGNLDIYKARADGTGLQRLTTSPAMDVEPTWSAATGRIAFRSNRDGRPQIYVMNENGSGQTRLTSNQSSDHTPAWSPDGTRIAFVSLRDGNAEIYVMNADGSNVVRLTNHPEADLEPAWSPDGATIAYTRGQCGTPGCPDGIHVVGASGQGGAQLTQTAGDAHPAWSPDGTRIAFARPAGCEYYYNCTNHVGVMSATGTSVMLLPRVEMESVTEPSWSPTGSRLLVTFAYCQYYGCYPGGIAVIRTDGSDPVVIIPRYALDPTWRR